MFRFVGLFAVALALLAAGCSSKTTLVDSNSAAEGITVEGQGSAFGEPDIALLTLGVESSAPTVSDARAQASVSMDAMLAALKQGGVADEDVQTTRFSVQPHYDFTEPRQEITGFTVSNIATVKIRDIDKAGGLIDSAVEAGGNNARVESLSFTIDDPESLESKAREDAMSDAKSKADALAKAGGIDLGEPRSISEDGGVMPVAFDAAAYQSTESAPTSIEVGELEVQISVSVVYGLD